MLKVQPRPAELQGFLCTSCPSSDVCAVQVTELFTDSKSRLDQCSLDLTEKQQR